MNTVTIMALVLLVLANVSLAIVAFRERKLRQLIAHQCRLLREAEFMRSCLPMQQVKLTEKPAFIIRGTLPSGVGVDITIQNYTLTFDQLVHRTIATGPFRTAGARFMEPGDVLSISIDVGSHNALALAVLGKDPESDATCIVLRNIEVLSP